MLPRPIAPGATLGLVSPASPLPDGELEAGRAAVEAMGFRTKLMPHACDRHDSYAGTDSDRAADLHRAFDDPQVDGVLCTRGGYGCARLIPYLDLDRLAASDKPFIGFSDITTLHLALNRRGRVTLHGPMIYTFAKPRAEWVSTSFIEALAGRFKTPLEAPSGVTVRPGVARGELSGGCLTLLADSLGNRDAFVGRGKLVVLEDVGEQPHRVDAQLTHLLNAGAFDGVAGFVVGEFTETDEKRRDIDLDWRTIVRERLDPLGVPMIFNYPIGHIDAMLTLPLGHPATLDANAGALSY
ncbi:S66 peptidase family protein [Fimbriimonas ginsengisoli]|uniref:Muramoyltetrapeptide carboxypeptidase n=1 Tax=Fimbriimonas ginsengisoli Gsoil 348 TaxID=661478 RepID=A0A068NX13_FIMGI|nr:LD-carboxypeptidase [Fimbriimonas ginsengisoli]AIE86144.1 Muramoyltetrapeptide carboxypeptidase [Fimbriimonas ginsengisoli Gsoil 348]